LITQNAFTRQDFGRIPERDPVRHNQVGLVAEQLDAMATGNEAVQAKQMIGTQRSTVPKRPQRLAFGSAPGKFHFSPDRN
jgi:hypothetical protein